MQQFKVLFRKDWIYWKRNRIASILELGLPILLGIIMLALRFNIAKTTNPQVVPPRIQIPTSVNAALPAPTLKTISRLFKNCNDSDTGGYIALVPNNTFTNRLKTYFDTLNFTSRFFDSDSDLNSEVLSSNYTIGAYVDGNNVSWPNQVCFGVVFHPSDANSYNYSLRFNTSVNGYGDMYKTQLKKRLAYQMEDQRSFNKTLSSGVLALQMLIDSWIVANVTGVQTAPGFMKFMTSQYDYSNYSGTILNLITLTLTLSTLIAYLRVITRVVTERQNRNIEHMENMGLSKGMYLLSTYLFTMIVQFIVSIGMAVVLKIGILFCVNFFALFLLYFLFSMSVISIGFFVASFFTQTKRALITGLLLFLLLFIFYVLRTSIPDPSQGLADFVAIMPTGSLTQISVNFLVLQDYYQSFGFGEMSFEVNFFAGRTFYIVCTVEWVAFTLLAFYLLYVWPHEIGLAKHPLFIFGYEGKRAKEEVPRQLSPDSSSAGLEKEKFFKKNDLPSLNPDDFEEVEEELKAQERQNKTVRIRNLYKMYSNNKVAVRDLNFDLYSDQIFALLGHNGAGKTTTISMISGLLQMTSGTINIMGFDAKMDHDQVKKLMGICPQTNPVFPYMTVWEHMELYGKIKGVEQGLEEESKRLLTELDLYHKKDYLASKLSGGQKRKLCVAMAFVGDSKIVLLDEPTSGLDTYARRYLWEMLKKYKKDRLIILTTHNMDEADFLGDRIGIMSEGRLVTCGSSIFLKRRFGDGYELTVLKKPEAENQSTGQLKSLIKSHVPNATIDSEIGSEIKFRLPETPSGFRDLFQAIESNEEALGIQSFGIDMNTLEDVFIKVAKISTGRLKSQKQISYSDRSVPVVNAESENSGNDSGELGGGRQSALKLDLIRLRENNKHIFSQQLTALLRKRFLNVIRDWTTIVCEVLMPILVVIIGLAIAKIRFFVASPALVLNGLIYQGSQNFTANALPIVGQVDPVLPILQNFNSSYFASNQTGQLAFADFVQAIWAQNRTTQLFAYYFQNITAGFVNYTLMFNTTAPFIPFVAANQLTNALIATYQYANANVIPGVGSLPKPTTVSFWLEPLGITKSYTNLNATFSGFIVCMLIVQAMALIPNSLIQYIVKERENNAKHQQIVSGTSVWTYWLSNFIIDYIKYLIPGLVIYGLLFAFGAYFLTDGDKAGCTVLLILLYGVSLILLTYLMSFMFRSPGNAQIFAFIFFSFFSFILVIISFVLKVIPDTKNAGLNVVPWLFNFVSAFSLGNALMNMANDYLFFLIYDWPAVPGAFSKDIGGKELVFLAVFCVVYTVVLVILESWFLIVRSGKKSKGQSNRSTSLKAITPAVDMDSGPIDEDVLAEEESVKKQLKAYSVCVEDLEKVYKISGKGFCSARTKKRAVNGVTFGVEQGMVFCLLGTNGAGKTTTFKILTGDIVPSSGSAVIRGMALPENLSKVRHFVGYCPQFDSLTEKLTAEEHLKLYCDLKGIEPAYQSELIENMLESLNLTPYRNVQVQTYSGGNKRKLSIAIALIGQPPIVFLDEPSAGMDPEARRFMWNFIAEISSKRARSSIILTTHSMEEAQALASKVAIMVEGKLKTIGTIQRLKDKYGRGFEIEVKLIIPTEEVIQTKTAEYRRIVGARNPETLTGPEINSLLTALGREDLIAEIDDGRRGSAIYQRLNTTSNVEDRIVVEWIELQISLARIFDELKQRFDVALIEAYQSYAKFNISEKHRLSEVFGFLERELPRLEVANFAVREISLEQIFIQFANRIVHED